jgi:hypothetical protein
MLKSLISGRGGWVGKRVVFSMHTLITSNPGFEADPPICGLQDPIVAV